MAGSRFLLSRLVSPVSPVSLNFPPRFFHRKQRKQTIQSRRSETLFFIFYLFFKFILRRCAFIKKAGSLLSTPSRRLGLLKSEGADGYRGNIRGHFERRDSSSGPFLLWLASGAAPRRLERRPTTPAVRRPLRLFGHVLIDSGAHCKDVRVLGGQLRNGPLCPPVVPHPLRLKALVFFLSYFYRFLFFFHQQQEILAMRFLSLPTYNVAQDRFSASGSE